MRNTTPYNPTIALLERALRDLEPLNSAAQQLLQRCEDVTFATEVFSAITGWNAALIASIDQGGTWRSTTSPKPSSVVTQTVSAA